MPYVLDPGRCSVAKCPSEYKDHKWGHVEASREGWFFSKETGEAFCPDHLPDWVPAWRARKEAERAAVVGYEAGPTLIAEGAHGKERIRTLRCRRCGSLVLPVPEAGRIVHDEHHARMDALMAALKEALAKSD